jgi:hypothetical protein
MADFFKVLEAEISKNPPPRKVGFRPFAQAKKRWILMILLNGIFMGLFLWLCLLSIPFWVDNYGLSVTGQVTGREIDNGHYFLHLTYPAGGSKAQVLRMKVGRFFYGQCPDKGSIGLHYFPWLPSRPSFDGDSESDTYPEIFGPFILFFYFFGYCILFFSLLGEYQRFKTGVLARGRVEIIRHSSKGGTTAGVVFTYGGKDYSKWVDASPFVIVGEPVMALVNPAHANSNNIYFQNTSSLFQVKPEGDSFLQEDA